MYAYTTFAYAMMAIGSLLTALSIPIGSDSLQPLDKRVSSNATCNPRLGGLKLSDRRSAWSQISQTDTLIQYQAGNPDYLFGLPYIWSVGECTITADLIDIHQPEVLARANISAPPTKSFSVVSHPYIMAVYLRSGIVTISRSRFINTTMPTKSPSRRGRIRWDFARRKEGS